MLPWSLARPLLAIAALTLSLLAAAPAEATVTAAVPPLAAAGPAVPGSPRASACAGATTRVTKARIARGQALKSVKRAAIRVQGAKRRLRLAEEALAEATRAGDKTGIRAAEADVARAKQDRRQRQVAARQAHRRLVSARKRTTAAEKTLKKCRDLHTPARLLSAKRRGPGQLLLTFNHVMGPGADDPAQYSATPAIFVTGATRLGDNRRVLLSVGTTFAVDYLLAAPGLVDAGGNPMHPAHSTATFTGETPVDATRPAVVSAGSTGNRTTVVQFSKPMGDSVLAPTHFSIAREPTITGGGVAVSSVRFVDDSRLTVELTTGAQSDVDYRLRVADVRDISGLPLAARTGSGVGTVDPSATVFRGTAAPAGPQTDSDCDTLTDAEEARGYEIQVRLANGAVQTRQVTSDPGHPGIDCDAPDPADDVDGDGTPDTADTDGDGLDDSVEKSLGTDPRDGDTDDDALTDDVEYNETFSDPASADTDADGLSDGLESTYFITSSILADTDGDQIEDGDEITLANRDPRVADLPEPALSIGEMNLALDVRFIDTTGSSSSTVDTKQVTSTLTQTESREFSSTDSRTLEAGTKLSQTAGFEVGYDDGPTANLSFSTTSEQSFNSTFLTSFTDTSKDETQFAREQSLTSEVGQADSAERVRQVDDATIQVAVSLRSLGDIAFTLKNPQVTALIQDPKDPAKLRPVATLVPDAEPETGFNLGPLVPERGPLIFSATQVFPQLVDDLMRNPRGLVFKFSNYDIVDELGRNFAYTSQDINDRTAGLVIDYGGFDADGDGVGDQTERQRIATGTGRRVDTNGDGVVDDEDRQVVFDADGNNVGITLRDALAAMGLTEYDEDETPTASLSQAEIDHSYSIRKRADGGDRIFRVRRTGLEPGVAKQWEIVTPTGIDQSLTLDTLIMNSGETFNLSFIADTDEDRLPAVLESIQGCVDSPVDGDGDGVIDSVDTDDDGLDDRFESLVGWTVTVERGSRPVLSSCSSEDTDADGLTDDAEAPGDIERDADGLIAITTGHQPARDTSGPEDPILGWSLTDPITDPTTPDTDLDGLEDAFELEPYQVPLLSPPAPSGAMSDLLPTSPEFHDSDRDTASDGVEYRVGGAPRLFDFDNFGDDDGDGVVNILEGVAYPVTVRAASTATLCTSRCPLGTTTTTMVTSKKSVRDTDGDGLDDGVERTLGTNPNLRDTDGDGLRDDDEVLGFELPDLGQIVTDPLSVDTDRDKRSDGVEARLPGSPRIIVRVPGEAPYEVFTDPTDPDEDLDQLVDGDEARFGTDTGNFNTDGDNRSDYNEATTAGRRPLVPDLHVKVQFSGLKVKQDADDGDSAGEFRFAIGVTDVDGDPVCGYPGHCGEDDYQPFTSFYDSPYRLPLEACAGRTTYDGACREGTQDRILVQSEYEIPTVYRQVDVGSVGTGEAELESFSIDGWLNEMEGDDVDCHVVFPDPQQGDNAGTYLGTDLVAGTTVINLTRELRCASGEHLEFTLLATYTAS